MTWSTFLMDASATNLASNYLPIGIQLLFAAGFVATMIGVSQWVGPKRNTSDKLENFASGIETHGDARQPMAIKYFLVAILFVLFDIEIVFMYPWAVNFKQLSWNGFYEMLVFMGLLLVGFLYVLKKGILKWEK